MEGGHPFHPTAAAAVEKAAWRGASIPQQWTKHPAGGLPPAAAVARRAFCRILYMVRPRSARFIVESVFKRELTPAEQAFEKGLEDEVALRRAAAKSRRDE